jgi:hypothetical protein
MRPLLACRHLLRGALIRRRACMHKTPLDRFTVLAAGTVDQYLDAFGLVHAAYACRGICPPRGGLRAMPHHALPEATVLVAYERDLIVGTMTVTLDSPAGLPLDADYPEACERLRRQGGRLVEYGALAVVERCRHAGVTTLLAMAAHWLSHRLLRATDCVIGIHPRAAPFYDAMFGFRPLGAPRDHAELHAPVIGMTYALDRMRSHLAHHFRRPLSSGLLPQAHFCDRLPACVRIAASDLAELCRGTPGPARLRALDELKRTRPAVAAASGVTVVSSQRPAAGGASLTLSALPPAA